MKAQKSYINVNTIQREFLLSHDAIMTIAQNENWIAYERRGLCFDRDVVYTYFKKNNIKAKTYTWKQICELFGVDKSDVFNLISKQKWRPISKAGTLWTFAAEPIDKFFETYDANNYKADTNDKMTPQSLINFYDKQ